MKSARAFRTQYLTIMLIVVSVLVSSYVRRSTEHQNMLKTAQIEGKPRPVPRDIFVLEEIFNAENELNADRVEALAQLLKSHDLVAEVTVSSSEKIEAGFEVGVGRALALMKGLTAQGVGMEIVHVYAGPSEVAGNGAEVRLYEAP